MINISESPGKDPRQILSFYNDQNALIGGSFDPKLHKEEDQEAAVEMASSVKKRSKKKESLATSYAKSKTGRKRSKQERDDARPGVKP